MCWFVTIGVAPAGAAALEDLGRARAGLGVHRSSNPHLARLFPPTDVRFTITRGGCSCGIYREPRSDESSAAHEKRARERYQKKGWSEAKIDRALAASTTSKAAHSSIISESERAFRDAVEAQVRLLGSARLFAHMDSGSRDEEPVTAGGRRRIDLAEFLSSSFPPDELVEVVLVRP